MDVDNKKLSDELKWFDAAKQPFATYGFDDGENRNIYQSTLRIPRQKTVEKSSRFSCQLRRKMILLCVYDYFQEKRTELF